MTNVYHDNTPLEVSIKSKEESLYEGKAVSVTSLNERGEFDIISNPMS